MDWKRLSGVLVFVLFIVSQGWAGSKSRDYRVGDGDVLDIQIFGEKELSRTVRVSSHGMISYPLIGRVNVGGNTPVEIEHQLTRLLGKDYLVAPQVTVSILEYVSKQVQVLGAVNSPGTYNLTGHASVTGMLARAGGLSEDGGRTILLVRRDSKTGGKPISVDIHAVLTEGKNGLDLGVKAGDMLFVPVAEEVYVMGEVMKPGSVAFSDGMSLLQAISKVGAFKATAAPSRIQIIRRIDGNETILKVNAREIQEGRARDVALVPEDLITVPKSIF